MRSDRRLSVAVFVVIAALMIVGGVRPACSGSIGGRVVRKLDGVGLPGISVKLFDGRWQVLRSTVSGESGGYVFQNLAEGRYFLQALGDRTYAGRFSGDTDSRKDAAPVTVSETQSPVVLDILLQRLGVLAGRVVSSIDCSPIEQVQIRVYDHGWKPLRSVRTDSSGSFTVGGLSGGRYYLLTWNEQGWVDAVYPGHALQPGRWPPEGGEPVRIELDAAADSLEIALHPGGAITGRVTRAADEAALEGIGIAVLTPSLELVRETTTRAKGAFSVSGLPTGSYHVRTSNTQGYVDVFEDGAADAESAKLLVVQQGNVREGVNFKLVSGGRVSGRITDLQGVGIPKAEVQLYDESWLVKGSGVSDDQGNYCVVGLASGVYKLKTSTGTRTVDRCYGSEQGCFGARLISVQAGRTEANVNLSLAPAGMLSGVVVDRSTGTGLRHVYISVFDREWQFVSGDEADLRGGFSIEKLPEGAYYVQATNSEGYGEVYYRDTRSREGAATVRVIPGRDPAPIQLELGPRP